MAGGAGAHCTAAPPVSNAAAAHVDGGIDGATATQPFAVTVPPQTDPATPVTVQVGHQSAFVPQASTTASASVSPPLFLPRPATAPCGPGQVCAELPVAPAGVPSPAVPLANAPAASAVSLQDEHAFKRRRSSGGAQPVSGLSQILPASVNGDGGVAVPVPLLLLTPYQALFARLGQLQQAAQHQWTLQGSASCAQHGEGHAALPSVFAVAPVRSDQSDGDASIRVNAEAAPPMQSTTYDTGVDSGYRTFGQWVLALQKGSRSVAVIAAAYSVCSRRFGLGDVPASNVVEGWLRRLSHEFPTSIRHQAGNAVLSFTKL